MMESDGHLNESNMTKREITMAEREADNWQPIETAPKDGARLWLFWPLAHVDDQQAIGWWIDTPTGGYWTDALDCRFEPPSHWQPLPPPPASKGASHDQA